MSQDNTQMNRGSSVRSGGYTLLFAVLVSSIVLAVALSILSISRKEFLLSSSARESAYSFYAADTGMECAHYYDVNTSLFKSTSTSAQYNDNAASGQLQPLATNLSITQMSCAGSVIQIPNTSTDGITTTAIGNTLQLPVTIQYDFWVPIHNLVQNTDACAVVSIFKKYSKNGAGNQIVDTDVSSKGYNVACGVNSPKKVERNLVLSY